MEENRRVRKRDRYKRLITVGEACVLIAVELVLFGLMWYRDYEVTLTLPFWRRGNWAVIGMYGIIIILSPSFMVVTESDSSDCLI